MSRNSAIDYTKYVHQYTATHLRTKDGVNVMVNTTRWAVARKDPDGTFHVLLFSKNDNYPWLVTKDIGELDFYGGFDTKTQALRKARYIVGGK